MKILGPPTATLTTVRSATAALNPHPRFLDEMLLPLWKAAMELGIDPVVMVAQSAKETAWGRFGRAVTPAHFNTAGIKRYDITDLADDDPNAHARFASWRVGAMAHGQHLRAYAGVYFPTETLILSPRYDLVVAANTTRGIARSVEELSGRWAVPGTTYGPEVVAMAKRLGSTG